MKKFFRKGALMCGMLFAFAAPAFAETITTSDGDVLGTCTIVSSGKHYDRNGNEYIDVKVKIKNNTGKRIKGVVYGNNGGQCDFILDKYQQFEGYLEKCQEAPQFLICNEAVSY